MKAFTNFDEIKAGATRVPELVEINSIGASIYIRHLTAKERDAHESSVLTKGVVDVNKLDGIRQRLVSICVCDQSGAPIAKPEQWGTLDADQLDEIAGHCSRINGMGVKEAEEADADAGKG